MRFVPLVLNAFACLWIVHCDFQLEAYMTTASFELVLNVRKYKYEVSRLDFFAVLSHFVVYALRFIYMSSRMKLILQSHFLNYIEGFQSPPSRRIVNIRLQLVYSPSLLLVYEIKISSFYYRTIWERLHAWQTIMVLDLIADFQVRQLA